MNLLNQKPVTGSLFSRDNSSRSLLWQRGYLVRSKTQQWAYVGLYLFTLLLYLRPNDWVPGLGAFPLVKFITFFAPLTYVATKIARNDSLTIWPIELKMLLLILALGLITLPFAQSRSDSLTVILDSLFKIIIIFVLIINVIDRRERLLAFLNLLIGCGTLFSLSALLSFIRGDVEAKSGRIEGLVGGVFGNPNDLSVALNIILPLAIVMAISNEGSKRKLYSMCAFLLALAVILTFSRAGFLGLVVVGGFLLWRLQRRHRVFPIIAVIILIFASVTILPGGYGHRLATIFNPSNDETESAQQRQELLFRAVDVAIHRPILGVGLGNFHLYSRHEMKAHNSYLEIWAEIGLPGLFAYLILLFAPFRGLRKIENDQFVRDEFYYLSLGLQAAIASYLIGSFFASIQYLWFVYYPIGFAISLQRITHPELSLEHGVLWLKQKITRPVFEIEESRWQGLLWRSGAPAQVIFTKQNLVKNQNVKQIEKLSARQASGQSFHL
jgi:putative inorganic carbon (hco3(-)) transporter